MSDGIPSHSQSWELWFLIGSEILRWCCCCLRQWQTDVKSWPIAGKSYTFIIHQPMITCYHRWQNNIWCRYDFNDKNHRKLNIATHINIKNSIHFTSHEPMLHTFTTVSHNIFFVLLKFLILDFWFLLCVSFPLRPKSNKLNNHITIY